MCVVKIEQSDRQIQNKYLKKKTTNRAKIKGEMSKMPDQSRE